MNRRRIRRVALTGTVAALLGAGGFWAVDAFHRMGLEVNCQSDNLGVVAQKLREYADRHDGRFPPLADVPAVFGAEAPSRLWCGRAGLPYQWDLRLSGCRVDTPVRRAVAWCPPGGHGRYVGAITACRGEVRVEALTVDALRALIRESE